MNYWLMKSEPDAFSIDDLREVKQEPWNGVRNYQARNFMRDHMQQGDLAFFYHSNCDVPGIAGVMQIATTAYPDLTAFDKDNQYFDPASNLDNPRWFLVDVKFKKKFKQLISLTELREQEGLINMQILRKGNRLSITPVTQEEWHIILALEGQLHDAK